MYGREFHEWQEDQEFQRSVMSRAASHLDIAAEHSEYALVCIAMAEGVEAKYAPRVRRVTGATFPGNVF